MNGKITFLLKALHELKKFTPLFRSLGFPVRHIQAVLTFSLLFTATLALAQDKVLRADYRQ